MGVVTVERFTNFLKLIRKLLPDFGFVLRNNLLYNFLKIIYPKIFFFSSQQQMDGVKHDQCCETFPFESLIKRKKGKVKHFSRVCWY